MRVVHHERVPRTGRAEDLVTDLGEDVAEHVEEVTFVFDHEDTSHLCHGKLHTRCHP